MSMQIKKVLDWILLMQLSEVFFNSVSLWSKLFDQKLTPLSVQVKSCQITSVCPVDYAIRIHHWNNKDLVFFQERVDLRLVAYQVVDHSFTYEGTDRLAWMLPGSYQYGLFTFPCFSPYPYCWYDIICKSMSQSFNLDVNLRVGLIFLQ